MQPSNNSILLPGERAPEGLLGRANRTIDNAVSNSSCSTNLAARALVSCVEPGALGAILLVLQHSVSKMLRVRRTSKQVFRILLTLTKP